MKKRTVRYISAKAVNNLLTKRYTLTVYPRRRIVTVVGLGNYRIAASDVKLLRGVAL